MVIPASILVAYDVKIRLVTRILVIALHARLVTMAQCVKMGAYRPVRRLEHVNKLGPWLADADVLTRVTVVRCSEVKQKSFFL